MNKLAHCLKATKLFAPLSLRQISKLLERGRPRLARAGDVVLNPQEPIYDHLILVDGVLDVHQTWIAAGGGPRVHIRTFSSESETGACGLLSAAWHNVRAIAVTDIRYLLIDGDSVDEMLGWNLRFAKALLQDECLKQRMELVKHVSVFRQLPLDNVELAFRKMHVQEVEAGDTVITQGSVGYCYYLIEEGQARVLRADPFTNEAVDIAGLGPGDAFGEEALLQAGYRNATVKMATPGRLLVLHKTDFDALIKPGLAREIGSAQAHDVLAAGQAQLLDCRYDMEYEESRIPGAQLAPLDRLREEIHYLNPEASYIVYCRSGRRSLAAAFLLRERNIQAVSLAGGIKEWPYAMDAQPLGNEQVHEEALA